MKTYKIALFGELMDAEWNPMEKSLYEHIKPHLRFKRNWDELEGIFEPKTGYVNVSLRAGVGA